MMTKKRAFGGKARKLTAAQRQLITGLPQPGVNKYEIMHLEHPSRPEDFERLEELLAKADGLVSPERIRELRTWLEAPGNLPPMSAEFCAQAEAASKAQYDASPGMQALGGSWRDYYHFYPVSEAA